VQYEENQRNAELAEEADFTACGTVEACSPLTDWNNFVSLLMAPNLDGIYDFVYGHDCSLSPAANKDKGPPPVDTFESSLHPSNDNDSTSSLPFDEEVREQERSAIEMSSMPSANSFAPEVKEEETVEIHQFSRLNDSPIRKNRIRGPVQRLREFRGNDPAVSDEDSFVASPAAKAAPFLPKIEPKVDIPDEEAYDTEFTLKFLRVSSMIWHTSRHYHHTLHTACTDSQFQLLFLAGGFQGWRCPDLFQGTRRWGRNLVQGCQFNDTTRSGSWLEAFRAKIMLDRYEWI